MKKYYAIVLFVFAFQLISTAVIDGGIFHDSQVNDVSGGVSVSELNSTTYDQMEVNQTVMPEGILDSLFTGAGLLIDGLKMLVIVFLKTLIIYPTLTSYGVPAVLALPVQGMNTVIQALALLEFKTGRRTS